MSPLGESLAYTKSIQNAGGAAFYTMFKGGGHHGGLWNNALNGTITYGQVDAPGFIGRKEYVKSNFPFGDWFESLIPKEETQPQPKMNGVKYKVYNIGSQSKLPDFSQLKPIDEGVANNFRIDVSPLTDMFGMVFESNMLVDNEGDHFFLLGSDDGSKLYIDDKLEIDNDGLHGLNTKTKHIHLSKGFHKIRVEYFENKGGQVLKLNLGELNKNIPDHLLFTEYNAPATYNISVSGATLEEKDAIFKIAGDKAKII